ncbi:MAG: hypothetical protein ACI4V7_07250, partial [Succinivibrionaceae bacterium]
RIVSGGSENHLVLLDMKGIGISGKEAENRLRNYNIICNKNMISGDLKPADCTGIRIGTPAVTIRGFTKEMCFELGTIIAKILLKRDETEENTISLEKVTIKTKLAKMLDKVGPFYNKEVNYSPTPSDIA